MSCLHHGCTFWRSAFFRQRSHSICVALALAAACARLGELDGGRRVRALGLVGAADLGEGGYRGQAGWNVFEAALARGVFLRPLGDTVYVTPPLNISEADLTHLLDVLTESVRQAC